MFVGCMVMQAQYKDSLDVWLQEGKVQWATSKLEEAFTRQPSAENAFALGEVFSAQRDWKKAVSYYKIALDKDDNVADYHFGYAGATGMIAKSNKLKALGLIDDIIFHFEESLRLDPGHLETRWALIDVYLEIPGFLGGSKEKAEKQVEALKRLNPVEGLLAQAYVNEQTDEGDEKGYLKALEMESAIDFSYPRKNIHYQLGKAAAKNGTYQSEGIKHLQWFLQKYRLGDLVEPKWAHYYIGVIRKQQGRMADAQIAFKTALQQDPTFKQAQKELTK